MALKQNQQRTIFSVMYVVKIFSCFFIPELQGLKYFQVGLLCLCVHDLTEMKQLLKSCVSSGQEEKPQTKASNMMFLWAPLLSSSLLPSFSLCSEWGTCPLRGVLWNLKLNFDTVTLQLELKLVCLFQRVRAKKISPVRKHIGPPMILNTVWHVIWFPLKHTSW